jgi:hypothetical protein
MRGISRPAAPPGLKKNFNGKNPLVHDGVPVYPAMIFLQMLWGGEILR